MGWTAVNDQENTVLGANHQPPKKLDENVGVDAAFFLDHEPHMAARSHRRDQTHVVSRPRTATAHNARAAYRTKPMYYIAQARPQALLDFSQ